ncbi:MAG: hypothetical protein ACFFDX_02070 [Candidatus Odinarchaeota archaeon]
MSKYKELITICNTFQDFTYIASFKQTLEELQKKLEEEKRARREIESKKKFEIPGQIKFTQPVTVKPLPVDKSKIHSEITPKIDKIVIKGDKSKVKETKIGKLTLFKPSKDQITREKDASKPEDIKVETLISPRERKETIEEETPSKDFSKILKELIEKKGSTLSLKLCEHLVNQLQTTLGRTLTLEDVETAAEIFIKQENL